MVQPIGLADYDAALGLPHPEAELAMLDEKLVTIALYPDTLDALRRVREQQCEDSRRLQVSPVLCSPVERPPERSSRCLVLPPSMRVLSSLTGRSTLA